MDRSWVVPYRRCTCGSSTYCTCTFLINFKIMKLRMTLPHATDSGQYLFSSLTNQKARNRSHHLINESIQISALLIRADYYKNPQASAPFFLISLWGRTQRFEVFIFFLSANTLKLRVQKQCRRNFISHTWLARVLKDLESVLKKHHQPRIS